MATFILPEVMEPDEFNKNYVLYWNHIGLELMRLTHSVGGPQRGPTLSSRAIGIQHIAMNDAYFAIRPDTQGIHTTYLSKETDVEEYRLPRVIEMGDARTAVAAAAITVLSQLYTQSAANIATASTVRLRQELRRGMSRFPGLNMSSPSYTFGKAVGTAILRLLDIRPDEIGAGQGNYMPREGRYRFSDDPTNPVRLVPVDPNNPNGPREAVRVYHAPFYGATVRRLAVQMTANGRSDGPPTEHIIADPPVGFGRNDRDEYEQSFREVYALGGAIELNTTKRKPDMTAAAYYWAYDGVNLIGTPPRLYNQILRKVAWDKKPAGPVSEETNEDFIRLFALANAAMADAGIFCWREKYTFEFWRPISGVRNDDGPLADPFWLNLGSPDTNRSRISFTPPFPAYPSGHASFGGAIFQAMRLYYRRRDNLPFKPEEPDNIGFEFVSEELNGVSRDLRQDYDPTRPIIDQPGIVRTRVPRHFRSLWEAIFENAISRVWLGVHWNFDAFAAEDTTVQPGDQQNFDASAAEDTTVQPGGHHHAEGHQRPVHGHGDGPINKNPADIRYDALKPRGDRPGQLLPVGGVPLGIGIANDVFGGNLSPTPPQFQP